MIDKRIGKRVKQARERLGIYTRGSCRKDRFDHKLYFHRRERDVISALREADYFAQWLGDIR